MEFSSAIVADFAVIMAIAAVVTFIFHKLRQPLILGYLIAGVIIGPYSPPFSLVSRLDVLGAVADLGVILLLFGVGLEFPLAKLRKIGFRAYFGISFIEIALMFGVSYGVGKILGWSYIDSLFLGAALASSSTVIIAKVLRDFGKLKDVSALIMMGVLIAEDLIVVAMLAVITSILSVGNGSFAFPEFAWTMSKIALFIVVSVIIGILLIPRIIDWVSQPEKARDDQSEHDEVLMLVALGLCFGLAILSNTVGLSVAIGAFLMGIFVASSRSAAKVASLTSHIRDMFAAIFFVSMGAFIDITQFRVFLIPGLIVTAMMVLGKVIGCGLGAKIFGYHNSVALRVGLGMGQIGEFAFIVMRVGQELNVVSPLLFPTVATAVVITAFLTPYMIRLSYKLTPTATMATEGS